MLRFTTTISILALLPFLAGTSATAGTIYVTIVSPSSELGYFNTSSPNSLTVVGGLPAQFTGLSFDGSGNLYGTDAKGNLYSVNPTTGASVLIGTGLLGVQALTWDPDLGSMLAGVNRGGEESIYTVSLSDGSMSRLTSLGEGLGDDPSVAVSPTGGIYVLGNTGEWMYIPPGSVDARPLDRDRFEGGTANGAAFVGDQLYWSATVGTESDLYTLNPSTGAVTLLGPIEAAGAFIGAVGLDRTESFVVTDLAGGTDNTSDVPEPPTVLLCGAGCILAAYLGRRMAADPR